ncbi:hypothetical protein BZL30_4744 [Mycobacterium kansasii]|uniref:Uncharacterized protein n=1 Tax=Mycobacterium kansasii TaxID=1768 RepID=A0A1V3X389_MYCKA|nr:hypothetical protein BZL30_4744 [Mycobacterium kansasii]
MLRFGKNGCYGVVVDAASILRCHVSRRSKASWDRRTKLAKLIPVAGAAAFRYCRA